MNCKNCGIENRDDAKSCRKCGASLSEPHKHRFPRVTLVVVIALSCIGFLGFLLIQHVKDPHQDTVKSDQECLVIFDGVSTQVRNVDDARKVVIQCADQIGMQNAGEQLGECSIEEFLGETYYRFDQEYEGVPVYGRSLTLNVDEAGECQSLSSDMLPVEGIKMSAETDEVSIRQAVLEVEPDAHLRTGPELVVFPKKDGGYTLAYIVDVMVGDTWKRYFVSAETASIVATEQLNSDENVGSLFTAEYGITAYDASKKEIEQMPLGGTDENGASYTFKVESDGTCYFIDETGIQLEDDNGSYYIQLKKNGKVVAKKAGVSTVSVNVNGTSLSPAEVNLQKMSKSDDNTMAMINNTVTVMDFYDDILGRKSYNGTGGSVTLVSNAKITWEHNGEKIPDPTNALSGFTTPYQTSLVFGYENPASLNTVGHEFTHSVEASICAMEYAGESGALKEGTSDVFGELVEDYQDNGAMDGSCDWKQGSRNLADPNNGESTSNDKGKYPATYKQAGYWADTNDRGFDNDYGNVHKNSTVVSHAAYLMCKGNLDGEALTTTELAQIHLASFYMLTKRCPFALYAGVMERKASDLLAPEKAERVEAAFREVGICSIEIEYVDQIDDMYGGQPTTDEVYTAYAAKLEEYLGAYGQPVLESQNQISTSISGVSLAELVDFDGDGLDELLVSYRAKDSPFRLEIWQYKNGTMSNVYEGSVTSQGTIVDALFLNVCTGKRASTGKEITVFESYDLGFAKQNSDRYSHQLNTIADGKTWPSVSYEWHDNESRLLIDGVEVGLVDSLSMDGHLFEYYFEKYSCSTYTLYEYGNADKVGVEVMNRDGNTYYNYSPIDCVNLTRETMHRLGIDSVIDNSNEYVAYADKIEEHLTTYGVHNYVGSGGLYAKRFALAELIDFDGDGSEELLVAYGDPNKSSMETTVM